jgi:two-component system LytT family sensor kinase
LTENAFKFVSSFSDKPNTIIIKITVKDGLFAFHICNTTELNKRKSAPGTSGIGLVNLKRRLELLYPDKYKLTSDQQDGHYKANLEIELE